MHGDIEEQLRMDQWRMANDSISKIHLQLSTKEFAFRNPQIRNYLS
jgi:hypothetical protein